VGRAPYARLRRSLCHVFYSCSPVPSVVKPLISDFCNPKRPRVLGG